MKKGFKEFLIENELEYCYYIKSVYDLYQDDVIDQIALSLISNEIRDIEKFAYKPLEKENKDFPSCPNSPTYTLKLTVGVEIADYEVAIRQLAFYTNIPERLLLIYKEGEVPHVMNIPVSDEEVAPIEEEPNAQSLTGMTRINAFMKELEDERKAYEPFMFTDVMESFVVSHNTMNTTFNRRHKNGYYVVERFKNSPDKIKIEGPFSKKPINYDLHESLYNECVLLNEGKKNSRLVYEASITDIPDDLEFYGKKSNKVERDKYEVVVQDMDSGAEYSVVVSATSTNSARNKGVEKVAHQEKLDPSALIAIKPEKD